MHIVRFDSIIVATQNGLMAEPNENDKQPKMPSCSRHTPAIEHDRSKRQNVSSPDEIVSMLAETTRPITPAEVTHYHRMGLRERVPTLPLLVPLVLSMMWRQTPLKLHNSKTRQALNLCLTAIGAQFGRR
jgi:hypothetical protein